MTTKNKPIRIFFSKLTQRFYASRAYKDEGGGLIAITGEKFDVTNDIADLIKKYEISFVAHEK